MMSTTDARKEARKAFKAILKMSKSELTSMIQDVIKFGRHLEKNKDGIFDKLKSIYQEKGYHTGSSPRPFEDYRDALVLLEGCMTKFSRAELECLCKVYQERLDTDKLIELLKDGTIDKILKPLYQSNFGGDLGSLLDRFGTRIEDPILDLASPLLSSHPADPVLRCVVESHYLSSLLRGTIILKALEPMYIKSDKE